MSANLGMTVVQQAFREASRVFCEYCRREVRLDVAASAPSRATADHRTPRCRGGRDARANIAIACCACNHAKGPLTAQEFLSCRHDPHKLAMARMFWARRLNGDPNPRQPKPERRVAKQERRNERLHDRVRLPDPGCTFCRGRGTIKVNSRVSRYCVCTLAPLDPERAAAYFDGRKRTTDV